MAALLAADAGKLPLAARSVDVVIGSPPYTDARTYGDGLPDGYVVSRPMAEWIDWMLPLTAECLRVSRGPVVWVIGCRTRDHDYEPSAEGLLYRWVTEGWGEGGPATRKRGSSFGPNYWRRNGVPGSGAGQRFRVDVEYILIFKRPGRVPYADPVSCGHPPKYRDGGGCTNRKPAWKDQSRKADGRRRQQAYAHPEIANPGNLIDTGAAGGGHTGHPCAHENEAPYPPEVPERFVKTYCPPGGLVLDPFCGSGTTLEVAEQHGRRAVGCDLRHSQLQLSRRRLATPHLRGKRSAKTKRQRSERSLFPETPAAA